MTPRGPGGRGPRRPAAGPGDRTPSEVVYTENKLVLRRYEPRADRRLDVPVVLVYAVINRPWILDFQPDRSVVRQFLDHGFDVYLVDWGEPSRLDTHLTLDDFVTRYLDDCLDVVCERTGADAVHLFGYCTGGTLAAIYAALFPERLRTLGLLAPVLNFDVDGGLFERWGGDDAYDPRSVADAFGNAPGEWLRTEFTLVDPVEYGFARYLRLAGHLDDAASVDRFARRLAWGLDSVDVAGGLYEQFLVALYRENRLMEGTLTVGGRTVDLVAVTMPVLVVVGTDDRFVPAAASRPFVEAIPSTDTEVIEFPTDHVGLSVGERSHAVLWPRVCRWLAARSDGPTVP